MPRLFRGEIIGSLELLKPVKLSGDCEVWLAADSNGDFTILKSAPRNSSEAEKILLSAKIIKNIKSPGLAEILSFGISEAGAAYVATKYAARGTLAKFIKNKRRLTQAQTVKMLRGTLAGLAALHDLGIVHRDVKPDNIFILQDGSAVLGGFWHSEVPKYRRTFGRGIRKRAVYVARAGKRLHRCFACMRFILAWLRGIRMPYGESQICSKKFYPNFKSNTVRQLFRRTRTPKTLRASASIHRLPDDATFSVSPPCFRARSF